MDPVALTRAEWTDIGQMLTYMWVMLGIVIFFSTNYLIGHVFIPSLVASGHVPAGLQKTRPLFYALFILGVIATAVTFVMVIQEGSVISRIYDTYWIEGGAIDFDERAAGSNH